ncbi:MAG: dTMP kinase [Bacilli bacterium]|nr:dTMP kinase [Bacilli bacterium]
MGKFIVIEGTDASGKKTQTNLLKSRLISEGYKVATFSFPNYEMPIGNFIKNGYLNNPLFKDNDPYVSSLLFAADRRNSINLIKEMIKNNDYFILDRYVFSNMGHQASKLNNKESKNDMLEWIYKLEFEMLELPFPDITIFLHVDAETSFNLAKERGSADLFESNLEHLTKAEETYMLIANKYNFKVIECVEDNKLKSVESISDLIYKEIKN